jgi:hypothetical protein
MTIMVNGHARYTSVHIMLPIDADARLPTPTPRPGGGPIV